MGETISVIIPVYNVENYLRACLDSVLASLYTNLEILCVDDGSTDSSGAILEEYARADSRIKVIHKANGGLSSARNAGLDNATGKYIAFEDSDDRVHEKYFLLLLEAMMKCDADLAVCSHTSSLDELTERCDAPEVQVLSREVFMSSHKTKSFAWGRIFKRNLIGDIRFDESILIEDAPFNAEYMRAIPAARIAYIDARLYFYYQREGSLSTRLGPDAYYELSEYYFECTQAEEDHVMQRIFAEESIKRGLSAMLSYYMERDTQGVRQCQTLMRKSVGVTGRKQVVYRLFIECPSVFKQFRFRQDPSLRGWKRKRREK